MKYTLYIISLFSCSHDHSYLQSYFSLSFSCSLPLSLSPYLSLSLLTIFRILLSVFAVFLFLSLCHYQPTLLKALFERLLFTERVKARAIDRERVRERERNDVCMPFLAHIFTMQNFVHFFVIFIIRF